MKVRKCLWATLFAMSLLIVSVANARAAPPQTSLM
jgi:hypothetical protein